MNKKRKYKKNRIIFAFILFIIVGYFLTTFIISITPYGKLRTLSYTKEVIKLMDDKTKDFLIDNKIYSLTVSKALEEKKFYFKNLEVYTKIKYVNEKSFISNINDLVELKYSDELVIKIFKKLKNNEVDKLIKNDYIPDLSNYIDISYFNIDNLERYIEYKEKEKLDYELTLTYVNIGLDKDYYDEEIVKIVPKADDYLALVNKYNYLPEDYEPKDLEKVSSECSKEESFLRKDVKIAFEKLCNASIEDGSKVLALSAYRSYTTQEETWNYYMDKNGKSYTYYYVAKPGFSEHQTGLALDLASGSNPDSKFSYTKDYTWTINNAHKYGFILRYDENKTEITGYNFEPWHIRYVGVSAATYIYKNKITFDEYIATR